MNKTYGKLTTISPPIFVVRYGKRSTGYLCKCSCGNKLGVSKDHLRSGRVKSCGCLRSKLAGDKLRTHGLSNKSSYTTWTSMKARCYNKNTEAYKYYGGRGITICGHWLESFENFYNDMGDKPKGKSIDRVDNNKGYSASNCKWSTPEEQNQNKRGWSKETTSRYKGVSYRGDRGHYRGIITFNNKLFYVGSFDNEYDCHVAVENKRKGLKSNVV